MTTAILFLFGLAIGSFLNVIASRYDPAKRIFNFKIIGGRSRCPNCGKTLRWFELIPLLSFLIQSGKCRFCAARISFQYPFVELASALILAFIPAAVGRAFQVQFALAGGSYPFWYYALAAVFTLAALTLVALSTIDFRLKIIPDQSNILITVLGLIVIFVKSRYQLFGEFDGSFLGHYAGIFGLRENIWINHLSAAAFGLAFFGLIVILSRGRGMGMGDLKLAAAGGVLLGWPDIALAVFLSFIIGSIWSIILMALRRKELKSTVPFGPFIALGMLLTVFFGKAIMDGYFLLFP